MHGERTVGTQAFEVSWQREAQQLAPTTFQLLRCRGLSEASSFEALDDLGPAELIEAWTELLGTAPDADQYTEFSELVLAAGSHAMKKRRLVNQSLSRPELREKQVVVEVYTVREQLLGRLSKKNLPPSEYPTSSTRKREDKDALRKKLADKIGDVILECSFPASQFVRESQAPERLLARFGAGRRVSTLQQRLRTFQKMRGWMMVSFGKPFPSRPAELLDYILDRGEEPCGPSVPQDILTMIAFFEDVGGRDPADKLGTNKMIRAVSDDLRLDLAANRPPRAKKKAHQVLVAVVAAWELMVCNVETGNYVRTYVWVRLVMIWAALRTGDLAGIPAMQLAMSNGNLSGKIVLSKTTGAGKKVTETVFHVSSEAWLAAPDWLEKGWGVFCESRGERPFLLALPSQDFMSMSQKEPSYVQMCTSWRKLFSETGTPVYRDDGDDLWGNLCLSGAPLLLPGCHTFWTGHSSRCTLATWAACIRIEKSRRDYVGRWRPSESDEYVRVSREVVWSVQQEVATAIRNSGGTDICFEEGVLCALQRHCEDMGLSTEEIIDMNATLMTIRSILPKSVPAPQVLLVAPGSVVMVDDGEQDQGSQTGTDSEEVVLSAGAWTVSCKRSGAAETLHQVGKCWRTPGVHYRRFIVLDNEEIVENKKNTNLKLYSRVCRECFPEGIDDGDDSSGCEASSGSSDSEAP